MPSHGFLDHLTDQAALRPHGTALVFREERVSYRDLLSTAENLRKQLADLGLPAGRPLAVSAKKSPGAIALVIALLMEQRQILLPSPELGEDVLQTLGRQASCSHILTVSYDADGGDRATVEAREVTGPPGAEGFVLPPTAQASLFLTTSGSTGTPKIVPLLGTAVDNFLDWGAEQFAVAAGSAVLSYAPLNFDLSLLDIWSTLAAGGKVVLVDQDRATDPAYLLGLFEQEGPELVQAVPMFFRLLAEAAEAAQVGGLVFKQARHVVFTGDAMPYALLTRLASLFPAARFHNLFGCTETNDSLIHTVDVERLSPDEKIPIGRPLPGVDALLLDEDGRIIPGEGTGELLVATPFQTSGYLETARNEGVFVPHPDGAHLGAYYRTGDMVTRRRDGTYVLEGRNDFHVKVRGVRTNMQEVEQVILQHPDVREAAVVALPDELAGVKLHALVQRREGSKLGGLSLRTHCAAALPRPAIPGSIVVGDVPLPRTPTGKPDRNLIKKNQIERNAA
ncbi:AMP-binding protein [Streptomyces sp. ISL-98]|uniref:AMP-binding protein n=1 Tax=Streptomyces sp. ISL-98 TaxID=2819192 RepID=UPI001BED1210|nr:AMP-binding protein [Streptomyces sp. ISL-98]MBT2507197.1 AMP-binding protein [Streptomyces sp. ISL-98]